MLKKLTATALTAAFVLSSSAIAGEKWTDEQKAAWKKGKEACMKIEGEEAQKKCVKELKMKFKKKMKKKKSRDEGQPTE